MNGTHATPDRRAALFVSTTPSWRPSRRPDSALRRILHSGEHLFHAGERLRAAYMIMSGSFKSYAIHADGEEQVLGFHGPGQIVGFNAPLGRAADFSVVALDISNVRVLAMVPADEDRHAALMLNAMYDELLRLSRLLHIDRHSTDRRLAEFLLDYSDRQNERGLSPRDLILPMARRDLAVYLGLAPETLSRAFSRLQTLGIVTVNNRQIEIRDMSALHKAAGEEAAGCSAARA